MEGRKYGIGAAIGVLTLVLSLWGYWGEGTASKVFPEKKESTASVATRSTPKGENADEGAHKKYDAASHIRGKPLPDPFHGEAIASQKLVTPQSIEGEALKVSSSKVKVPTKTKTKEKTDLYPKLQGIMSFGDKKRAVIAWHGESYTVGEGEQVGIWTVTGIDKKTVTLTGTPGTFTLSTR